MNSAFFRRHTRKSYGGENQNDLKAAEMKLGKLEQILRLSKVQYKTKNERTKYEQNVTNQKKIVNALRLKATSRQNNSVLSGITNTLKSAVASVTNAVTPNKLSTVSITSNQRQKLINLAIGYENLAKSLREQAAATTN